MKNGYTLPLLLALVLTSLALAYRLMLGTPTLENDDFQIYFMLCGGGENSGVFGIYTHVLLAKVVEILTNWNPGINWYQSILLALNFIACTCLNYLVFKSLAAIPSGSQARSIKLITSTLLLFYINVTCLCSLQYTHIAVFCGCVGSVFISQCFFNSPRTLCLKSIVGILLVATSYTIRTTAILPALILMSGICLAEIVSRRSFRPVKRAFAITLSLTAIMALLIGVQKVTYNNNPEWKTAADYLHSRVNIQDYGDNSELDKSQLYTSAGVDPLEIRIFKSFVYVPSMDSLEKVQAAEKVHRANRKGLCGIEAAGHASLLETKPEQFFAPFNSFMKLTPFVPLGCACALFLLMLNKEGMKRILPVLFATAAFILLLILVGRCVGRVMYPVLYVSTAWVMMNLPDSAPLLRTRLARAGAILFSLCCFLVSMRHLRPYFGATTPREQPWEYCASHPDTLFLTTCLQGCGLFPEGLAGYTYSFLKQTNIIAIADGWTFYTPAYRAALKARGITNPYLKLPEANARLVTFRRHKPDGMLLKVSQLHEMATGVKLSFRRVHSCGEFDFWQASPSNGQTLILDDVKS